MEARPEFICDHQSCGRSFPTASALSFHKRTCRPSKKRLQLALSKAKELWQNKKRDFTADKAQKTVLTASEPGPQIHVAEVIETPPSHTASVTINVSESELDLPISKRRCRRENRQPPKRYRDQVPKPKPSATIPYEVPLSSGISLPTDQVVNASLPLRSRLIQYFRTPRDFFGLSRKYYGTERPSHDPEDHIMPEDLCDSVSTSLNHVSNNVSNDQLFYPYPNRSSFSLGEWYWNQGVHKSKQGFLQLLKIVGDPTFTSGDICSTNWDKINTILASDAGDDDLSDRWLGEDKGWNRTAISILVPFHKRMAVPGPQRYLAGELYHRSIVSVIRERVTNDDKDFHYEPYELLWKSANDVEEVRIHGELYTSTTFLSEHKKLLESPGEPGCDAPRAVVALMFWSDATHLTSFGNAKLWPCYMYFGNDSKYRRAKPSCHLGNHIAYFQTLPDSFKDFAIFYTGGKGPNKALMTHCHREIFHAQWEILLDDEFLAAYEHGILIRCCDGVIRRLYPRIFTYSADYPEKVLLASIRKGSCPCPRCTTPKSKFSQFGAQADTMRRTSLAREDNDVQRFDIRAARRIIYQGNFRVNNDATETILKKISRVPTLNAFSTRLACFNFNLYTMLVVDLMHEFEQGVWKNLFTHLIRMLYASDPALVHEMDRRYRLVPRFGRDGIRKFAANSSEMKKMAAHNFEDLLQCAIPVFDGLFPDQHNRTIQELLFTCAHWHAFAKLRMHSDPTLMIFEELTAALGDQLRFFASSTCSGYNTSELPREAAARKRRQAKKSQTGTSDNRETLKSNRKQFNMNTYKHHALGDYVETIRSYGTCDSYSTELGELEHRTAKARYLRTDKREFIKQMTQLERRQERIRRIQARSLGKGNVNSPYEQVATNPDIHYCIGKSEARPEHIGLFVKKNQGDPAVQNFIPKLKKHLLPRIRSLLDIGVANGDMAGMASCLDASLEPSPNWQAVLFKHDRMYKHNIMRINFTTYDVRRDEDVIHSGTHAQSNVMVLNPETSDTLLSGADNHHPFWYARVLGIYHANVIYIGEGNTDYSPHRLEFLWVRWYELTDNNAGWGSRKLDAVSFSSMTREDSFGFLNPDDVIRASHVIPCMKEGVARRDGTGLSHCAQDHADWKLYYINRDMVIRYHLGHGVGHTSADHTITAPDPIISNLNVEMDREGNQGSKSPETPTRNLAAKQPVTLSDINEDDDKDSSDDEDEDNDSSDGDDDSDDGDDDNQEFDLSEEDLLEESDNELDEDADIAARYEMYGC